MVAATLSLSCALGIVAGDIVALVGGGGKTTTMFRLAAEIVAGGGRVLTTATTRIASDQIRLAPSHARSVEELPHAFAASPHVLLTGRPDSDSGKVLGVTPELLCALHLPLTHILVEADGSRNLPFKAPADHEPVIPACSTLVVPVVGIDALGSPLSKEFVHRPERVSRIHPGDIVTPEMVAAVLVHRLGGCKNAPERARIVPLINKIGSEEDLRIARRIAAMIIESGRVAGVALGGLAGQTPPVLELVGRSCRHNDNSEPVRC